ncbi:MAG: hypothetical protein MJ246_02245 [Clostridia bacterium]|nr:hypothetical protein [Clostridia bacterium]
MLEVLPVDIQYKTDITLRTFIQDGYLNWRLDQIIQGNIDDPRPQDPTNPNDPATPSNPKPQDPSKPVDPKNIDPKEKKEAIIKAIDDDGILKRIVELTNLKDDEKKTLLDYIMVLDTDVTDEDKENKKDNREKFLEYLADSAMGFDSIQDALPKLAKAAEDFYVIVDARLKIEEMLKKLADDPDSVNWDDILRQLDNLTDKQKQYLPDKFTEEIKKQYEEYLKSQDIKITQTGDDGGSKVNIYDVIGNLDIKPGDKPNILINMLNDIKNLNELRKLLSSDEVQTKLPDGDKTKQDERAISGFEFKVVDQSDPKRIIPLKSGSKVEIVFKLPELFAGKTVAFYTIADDGTVKKESVTMSSAVDGMCRASVLTDKYGKFIVTHNYVETIIRIKSNNGGATGTVTQSTKKLTDYICIPQSPNTVTSVKVYTYDIATGEYKEDTKLADTLHYPTYQIYESDEVPKGSIIEIQFLTESSGRKRVKELPSSRKFASYMKGKEVNFFKPNDGLTRAETAVLVSRILADDKESYEAEGKK